MLDAEEFNATISSESLSIELFELDVENSNYVMNRSNESISGIYV